MTEVWYSIKDFPRHRISNLKNVKGVIGRILKQYFSNKHGTFVNINHKKVQISKLIPISHPRYKTIKDVQGSEILIYHFL